MYTWQARIIALYRASHHLPVGKYGCIDLARVAVRRPKARITVVASGNNVSAGEHAFVGRPFRSSLT